MSGAPAENTPAEQGHAETRRGNSLIWRLIIPTLFAVPTLVYAIAVHAPREVIDTALNQAIARSEQTARQLQTLRAFYSDHVVARATKSGTVASPAYKAGTTAIPSPPPSFSTSPSGSSRTASSSGW
ncbi:MAG TPA: hypothetical protein VFU97_15715 [Xanthobacteraceae bacterium]|nr:hypothetical protein [Xanthobacteraceae bacterium]